MADVSHDIPDDGFHEIHLSGKQLVFLFMATTVVSIVIFLCGVLVGRGVREHQTQEGLLADSTAEAASFTPSPAPPVTQAPPIAAEPPAPAADTEDLGYKERLEGDIVAKERLKPAAKPATEDQDRARARVEPPPAQTERPAAVGGKTGTWVVQVHALRDRNVANSIVQRLSKKGYQAFLVAAEPPAGVYRVQIGRFKDRSEAERVVERLKKEEQFKPWITR